MDLYFSICIDEVMIMWMKQIKFFLCLIVGEFPCCSQKLAAIFPFFDFSLLFWKNKILLIPTNIRCFNSFKMWFLNPFIDGWHKLTWNYNYQLFEFRTFPSCSKPLQISAGHFANIPLDIFTILSDLRVTLYTFYVDHLQCRIYIFFIRTL